MALQGTLDTFSLPDVLRLLATTSKTGRLRIDGDRGRGSVWLDDGQVIDAVADRTLDGTPVDEVIFELLRFESGNFAFDGDDVASGGGEPEEVEGLLGRADALLGEWNELEAVVPSLEHEVTLTTDLSADEVTISADHWPSVVAVASGRTVGELASTLGLTELGVSRAVRDLVELGVADVTRSERPRQAIADAPVAASPAQDLPRRGAARPEVRADVEPSVMPDIPAPPAGHPQRAGWLGERTGEIPVVADAPPPAPRNGSDLPVHEPPAAPQVTPTPEPAPKGGLAARLGRRNGSPSPRSADGAPTAPIPPATNGTRQTGRTPTPPAAPTARANDAGPGAEPPADTGRGRVGDVGGPRRSDAAPMSPPRGSAAPGGPATPGAPAAPSASPFDDGRLGPSPVGRDTGQIRPVSGSALPPDLHWAADDTGNIPLTGNVSSPFSGISSLGPGGQGPAGHGPVGHGPSGGNGPGNLGPGRPTPPLADGEIAPHVAAMSPEARSAVQSTVGNAGGSGGARGGSQGEEIAQRGRLISFLSSVR